MNRRKLLSLLGLVPVAAVASKLPKDLGSEAHPFRGIQSVAMAYYWIPGSALAEHQRAGHRAVGPVATTDRTVPLYLMRRSDESV